MMTMKVPLCDSGSKSGNKTNSLVRFLLNFKLQDGDVTKCAELQGNYGTVSAYVVQSCPQNESAWTAAAKRLNCSLVKEPPFHHYYCLPTENFNELAEFCFDKNSRGLPTGVCLKLGIGGFIRNVDCSNFISGCPDVPFLSEDIYRYPACLQMNTEQSCYLAEPGCFPSSSTPSTSQLSTNQTLGTSQVTFSSATSTGKTSIAENNVGLILGITVPVLLLLSLIAIVLFLCRKKNKNRPVKQHQEQVESFLPETNGETTNEPEIPLLRILEIEAITDLFSNLPLDMLSFLRCLLLSKGFCIHLRNDEWRSTFKKIHATDMSMEDIINIPERICNEHNLIRIYGDVISFLENDIRDECMRHWSENWSESEINLFLFEASITTIDTYLKPEYLSTEEDALITALLIIRNETIHSFVQTFRIDVITRPVFEVEKISEKTLDILKLPRELMHWDIDSRVRYAEEMKTGSTTVFRTRAMIVGCAGAGKTTLVERLKNQRFIFLRDVASTVGLQVHYNMFEVNEKKQMLLGYSRENQEEGINVRGMLLKDITKKLSKKLLSLVDFGGQCAYYACHQVYLTERAIYLLVVDMSKDFEERVDATICQQHGTMFANWTYKDYFIFWLKSIHMYCGDNAAVILVPTHCENMTDQEISQVYDKLWNLLPQGSNLHHHIQRQRCFPLRFPKVHKRLTKSCPKDLEKCIVETIQKQTSWGENIPTAWLQFEALIQENKSKKMIELEILKRQGLATDLSDKFKDMLRFYHESGVILYFEERDLRQHIVVDVQWFVDSFKYIISDSNHTKDVVSTPEEWKEFDKTGVLSDDLLQKIWNSKSLLCDIEAHKDVLLLYMQRLGLIAVGEQLHFIPCMNKRNLQEERKETILNSEYKSSVLYFKFNFLPIFIFHRLIVSCLKVIKWQPLTDDYKCIYKDVGIFQYQDHKVVLAASNSYIEALVFASSELQKGVVLDIRKKLEQQIKRLTKTFHRNIKCEVGYSCGQITMCENIDDSFIDEETVRKKRTADCPRHALLKGHTINARELLNYWAVERLSEGTLRSRINEIYIKSIIKY